MKGLVRGTVAVVAHDDAWAGEAQRCIALLKSILKDDAADIQHIGSTAIGGICAKPIIDIAVAVKSLGDIQKHDGELARHGIYFRKKEFGEELLYNCGDLPRGVITHHIHAVPQDSEAFKNYLAFRDYLNRHPEDARAYAGLKQRLAARYPCDRAAYTAGKQTFIAGILKKAAAWRKTTE